VTLGEWQTISALNLAVVSGTCGKSEAGTKNIWRKSQGLDAHNISQLENGRREAGLRMLETLADAFKLRLTDLLEGVQRIRR
jgi:transcriptional regulator with XRE-family HTH domain